MPNAMFNQAIGGPEAGHLTLEGLFAAFEAAKSDRGKARLSQEICNALKLEATAGPIRA